MSTLTSHWAGLTAAQRIELERLLRRFDREWRSGSRAQIAAYLPTDRKLRSAALLELIVAEMEHRRRLGESPDVDDYVKQFPGAVEHRNWLNQVAAMPGRRWRVPTVVGRYELRELVGQGSFGAVYRAWDTELLREVAIKAIPLAGSPGTDKREERLLFEARTVARLRHAGIVSLYDVGRIDEIGYLVMEFVPGRTLADHLGETRLSPHRAARLLARIAEAVGYAHAQGFVHRDLKPANILVSDGDVPHVTDFGMANVLSDRESPEATRYLAGTPGYMAPEQLECAPAGPPADVYALGVILHQVVTGTLPDRSDSSPAGHCHVDPISLRNEKSRMPQRLDAICRKCLSPNPRDRYPTANELADDLRRFLDRQPLLWHPSRRTALLCRRAAGWMAVALCTTAVLLLAGPFVQDDAPGRSSDQFGRSAADRPRSVWSSLGNRAELAYRLSEKLPPTRRDHYVPPGQHSVKQARQLGEEVQRLMADLDGLEVTQSLEPVVQHLALTLFNTANCLRSCGQIDLCNEHLHIAAHLVDQSEQRGSSNLWLKAIQYEQTARMLAAKGPNEAAIQQLDNACRLLEAVVGSDTRYPLGWFRLFQCLDNLADWRSALEQDERQANVYERIVRHAQAYACTSHEVELDAYHCGMIWHIVGRAHEGLQQPTEAIQAYWKARRWHEQAVSDAPDYAHYRFQLGTTCHMLARQLRGAGRWSEARDNHLRAIELRQQLLTERPNLNPYWNDLAFAYHDLGLTLESEGCPAQALEAFAKALYYHQQLLERDPANPDYQRRVRDRESEVRRLRQQVAVAVVGRTARKSDAVRDESIAVNCESDGQ